MITSYEKFKKGMCYNIFARYFKDRDECYSFFDGLSEERRKKFFELSMFYNNFIKHPIILDYYTSDSFALIMIFSLIEATVNEEKHLTFDEYLFKYFEPITDKDVLRVKQEEYFDKFGTRRQVENFFKCCVDKECKEIFSYALRILSEDDNYKDLSIENKIELNAKLFYKWRSEFVHSAKIPRAFKRVGLYSANISNKKVVFTTAYTKEDFALLFEHGFLRYFGYKGDFMHEDMGEKINQYQKHTGAIVRWEVD